MICETRKNKNKAITTLNLPPGHLSTNQGSLLLGIARKFVWRKVSSCTFPQQLFLFVYFGYFSNGQCRRLNNSVTQSLDRNVMSSTMLIGLLTLSVYFLRLTRILRNVDRVKKKLEWWGSGLGCSFLDF